MKNIFIGLIAVWGLFLVSCETREPMAEVIERGLEVSKRQAVFLAKEVENQKGRLPRTYEGGELKTSDYRDRKSTRLNSSHRCTSRMPSSA